MTEVQCLMMPASMLEQLEAAGMDVAQFAERAKFGYMM